jgi:hypothetical protein
VLAGIDQIQRQAAAAAMDQAQVLVSSFLKQCFDKLPRDQVAASMLLPISGAQHDLLWQAGVWGHSRDLSGF